jgi:SAM-dependent methyltransferase
LRGDLITSNQVFEHVPDDMKGFRECYRVLRNGGALIFSVPFTPIPATEKLADIVDGRIVYYREPEYHDSRSSGPKSVLTFWYFSANDICERLSRAGFHAEIVDVMIAPSQKLPTHIVYAIKKQTTT